MYLRQQWQSKWRRCAACEPAKLPFEEIFADRLTGNTSCRVEFAHPVEGSTPRLDEKHGPQAHAFRPKGKQGGAASWNAVACGFCIFDGGSYSGRYQGPQRAARKRTAQPIGIFRQASQDWRVGGQQGKAGQPTLGTKRKKVTLCSVGTLGQG